MELEKYIDVVSFICGLLIIVLNSVEIWFLRNTMRRQGNSLVVLLKNLSIADLFIGVAVVLFLIVKMIEEEFVGSSQIVGEIREMFHSFCRQYFSTVSLLVLVIFTIIKMLNVTKNRRYTKARLRKICSGIWLGTLITLLPEYIIFRLGVYPDGNIIKYRTLHFPLMTYSAIIIFIYCFTKIFFKLRHNSRRLTRYRSGIHVSSLKSITAKTSAEPRFIKIAAFSLIAFVICWSPIATYYVLELWKETQKNREIQKDNNFYNITKVLAFCNSILNPIIFFLVYRPVCPRTFSKMYEEHMARMLEASKFPLMMDGINRWSRRDVRGSNVDVGQVVNENNNGQNFGATLRVASNL